jgi:hypothetical protein
MPAVCSEYAPRPGGSTICGNCLYPADCHDDIKSPATASTAASHNQRKHSEPLNDTRERSTSRAKQTPPESASSRRQTSSHQNHHHRSASTESYVDAVTASRASSARHARRLQVLEETRPRRATTPIESTKQVIVDDSNQRQVENGNFPKYLLDDFTLVANQCRFGLRSSLRMEMFLKRIAAIHDEFATRLIDVVDSELVRQVTWGDKEQDAMVGARQAWRQTLENTRLWATASKEMAVELEVLVGPMHEHNVSGKAIVERVHAQNERLVKPMAFYEKAVANQEQKACKVVADFQKYDSVSRSEKLVKKGRPTIEKYIETIDAANKWTKQ